MSGRMPEIQGGMSSDSAGGWDTLRFAATMYAVFRARGVCRARASAGYADTGIFPAVYKSSIWSPY